MNKIIVNLILILGLLACRSLDPVSKLDAPIPIPLEAYGITSYLPDGIQAASIGDEIVRVLRFNTSKETYITATAMTGAPFPRKATWMGTHRYQAKNGKSYFVFTSPSYYRGRIGVVLDENFDILEQMSQEDIHYAIVGVEGRHNGKLYRLRGSGKFFSQSTALVDYWALRYGGLKNGQYIFDIVNKNESQTREVLQTITVTPDSFFEGFTVRRVLIKGHQNDSKGVIKYSVTDLMTVNYN